MAMMTHNDCPCGGEPMQNMAGAVYCARCAWPLNAIAEAEAMQVVKLAELRASRPGDPG